MQLKAGPGPPSLPDCEARLAEARGGKWVFLRGLTKGLALAKTFLGWAGKVVSTGMASLRLGGAAGGGAGAGGKRARGKPEKREAWLEIVAPKLVLGSQCAPIAIAGTATRAADIHSR